MPIPNAVRALRSLAFLSCLSTASLLAQSSSAIAALKPLPQANRVAANADLGPQTQLSNHLPVWAAASAQAGKTPDLSQSMHVSIVLQRDPAVQAAFTQLLEDQQNPASALYHEWLTPAQVGQLFGPTASDLSAVTNWLTSQGLTVESVAPSNVILEVTGSGAAFASAFHTSFGYFNVGAETRFSALSEPSIPTALTSVVQTIAGLSEVHPMPQSHANIAPMTAFTQSRSTAAAATGTGSASPNYTYTAGSIYFLTPGDFATIYDINSVYSSGNTGATIGGKAQHIAVIGRSRVTPADVTNLESETGTAIGVLPNVIIPGNGVDPGYPGTSNPNGASAGDQGEATLDVDRTITTAPGAVTDLIVSGTPTSGTLSGYDGIYVSATWNVNSVVDPIMTISFGACEASAGQPGVTLWDTVFSAGAAEGISTFVSSGDSGADGCTGSFSPVTKAYAASINYICSSSYATCVGGTEFNDASAYSTYWSATNTSSMVSALSYIPEGGWNEPVETTSTGTLYIPSASGGGPSVYVTKPTWQTGITLADGARDTPDVAFTASSHDGFYACLTYAGASCTNGYFEYFAGTSAAAPSMAGIAALINAKANKAQGNMSPVLYKAYASSTTGFHDVTVASSGVTNCVLTTPSMCNNSVPNSTSNTTTSPGLAGYSVLTGYDLVTGLGSLDVAKFLGTSVSSPTVSTTLAITSVTPNPVTVNTNVTLSATLTPTSNTLGAPTGNVIFYANGTIVGSAVTISTTSPYTASLTTQFSAAGSYAITAVYSGDANYISSTASSVSLSVTVGPTFTVNPATTSATLISNSTTGVTDSLGIASNNGFAGVVTLSCVASVTTGGFTGQGCSITPSSVTLTSGSTSSATLTVTAPVGANGQVSVVVTATSGTQKVTSTINVTVTPPSFAFSGFNPASLSFTSGATTGNSTVATLNSTNGFAGAVTVGCSISTSSATYQPSCAVSPTTVTLAANGTGTTTVTIGSTTPHAAGGKVPVALNTWGLRGGAMLASLLCLVSLRRRRVFRSLAALAFLAIGISALSGCGGGGTVETPPQGSAGSYIVTVTGTGTTTGSSIAYTTTQTFTVTIN